MNSEKKARAVIIMGSEIDLPHADKIGETLNRFGVDWEKRIASAHKTPQHALTILRQHETAGEEQIVYIAVAGRSNALGGFIDANTVSPVIQSPPPGSQRDIWSSLDMPSGIAAPTAVGAETAALAAVKIFALSDPDLAKRYLEFQAEMKQKIYDSDELCQIKTGI